MSNTWWQEYYDDIDNQRLDSLGSRTAQNVVVRTAGFPAVEGLENVLNGQREFFSTFKSLRHDFTNTWEVEDTAVLEASWWTAYGSTWISRRSMRKKRSEEAR